MSPVSAGTAYVDIKPDWTSLNRGIAQQNSVLAGKFGKLGKVGGAALGASFAAAGLGKLAYDLGAAFDDAYDTIRVGTGATGKALDRLKGDFKNVVKGVPTDFKSASTAVADLNTRLGLTGKPLQDRSKQFLELSRITKTDVSTNIRTVTRAFGDWEVKTKDQSATLDRFFRAAQSSGATVDELADQVVKFGAPLRQVGFSLAEATAMFANFEKAGVNTQTMMPGIKMAMKTFFEKGIDPKKGLTAAFKGIQDGSIGASEAIKIFGTRAGGDMIEAVKQGRFNLAAMTKTLVDGKETIRGAGRDTMDFAEHWQMFKNRVLVKLEPIAIRVFDGMGKLMQVLPPIAERVVTAVRALLGPFIAVGQAITGSKTAMLALGAASAVLLSAWAGFAIVGAIRTAIGGMVTAFWALNAAMAANPIGLVVVALAALVAAFVVAYRESETFRDIITGAWNAIKAVTTAVWGAISGFLTGTFSAIKTAVTTYFGAYRTIITATWGAVSGVTSAVWGAIRSLLSGIWSALRALASTYFGAIRSIVTGAWSAVSSATSATWSAIRGTLSTVWGAIKTAAGVAWNGIRAFIVDPMRAAAGRVSDIVGGIKSRVKGVFDDTIGFAKTFGERVASTITGAFKGVAGIVTKFAIAILDVIDKIPGVDMKDRIKAMRAHAKESGYAGFARGGAFGRSGGHITQPFAVFGEETPNHNEWVIPENPSYRKRAIELWQAAGARIGAFAKGGRYSVADMAKLAEAVGAKHPKVMGAIGMAESSGDPRANGPPDGRGLWQIEWPIWAKTMRSRGLSDAYNAAQNARMMKVVQDMQGLSAWVVYNTGAYKKFLDGGGGGGILGKIGGIVGDLLSKGAGFLLDKLPGIGDLPDWLKGMGTHVLAKATSFIKDKVSGLVSGGDGQTGAGVMTGTNAKAQRLAKAFGATITSGYRSPARNAAAGGAPNSSHMKGSPANPGAHDFVPASTALLNAALGMGAKWVDNHDYGSGYHSHVSWFKKGGIYGPVMGSYAGGTSYVPQTGVYELHRGEAVIDADTNAAGAPVVVLKFENGMEWLRQFVHVEIERSDDAAHAELKAGTAWA